MLRAILNKSWRQHPTRHQLYGHLPPITKTIQVRRTRHAGHCWRSRDELIRDVLLWTLTHSRAKAGRPARTYIQQLCEDTECWTPTPLNTITFENLLRMINLSIQWMTWNYALEHCLLTGWKLQGVSRKAIEKSTGANKVNFLHSCLDKFTDYCGNVSDELKNDFIKISKQRKSATWDDETNEWCLTTAGISKGI